jgi:nicotinamide riboside transporter PnuC
MRRPASNEGLERWLAGLLHYGTWVAASTVTVGLAMALLGPWASSWTSAKALIAAHIMTAGIALFILLPIMRLILMLGVFLHQRDYRLSAIAALVLMIVVAGSMIGAT